MGNLRQQGMIGCKPELAGQPGHPDGLPCFPDVWIASKTRGPISRDCSGNRFSPSTTLWRLFMRQLTSLFAKPSVVAVPMPEAVICQVSRLQLTWGKFGDPVQSDGLTAPRYSFASVFHAGFVQRGRWKVGLREDRRYCQALPASARSTPALAAYRIACCGSGGRNSQCDRRPRSGGVFWREAPNGKGIGLMFDRATLRGQMIRTAFLATLALFTKRSARGCILGKRSKA